MNTPPIVLWKPPLSVGVADIDEDHKKLLKMINRLFGSALSLDPRQVLHTILDELTEYVVVHFDREETYMRRYAYPEYGIHKRDHQRLLDTAGRFKQNRELGLSINLKEEIEHALRQWLEAHIQEHDKRLGAFLNQQGIS
ncbi:MAG: hemerythrin family protein [Magnetococcales bacterium]|nr:hemerythrin family protein [Magnetococcales bacterium]